MTHAESRRWLRRLTWIAAGLAAIALASRALGGWRSGRRAALTPTRTPPPTATPLPSATPSPTLTPTPQFTPTPTPWPEDVNPLTGERMERPSVLDRVPIVIKISNWPPVVRPQAGINSADLIYEHYNEGWFATRWTAVYLGKDPERVGPVRSGRLIDLEIPAMYKGVLACSGFSNGILALVRDSDLYPDRVASPSVRVGRPVFYRDFSRNVSLEHTMYSSPALVREWAAERGVEGRQELEGMIFSEELASEFQGGERAITIEIPWNRLDAEWRYDEASGHYQRWTGKTPHVDALDGQQLTVANVVVLYVPQWNTGIIEEPHSGALSIQFALWYSNRAIIFRDGLRIDAFWQRWERQDMLTLTDEQGHPIPLKVGSTFFEVIPTEDRKIEITVEP